MKNTAETTTKKVTLATVKAFVRNSVGKGLHVKTNSKFDGMTDCVQIVDGATYRKVETINMADEYRLGIEGAWFVRDSRDYFTVVNTAEWTGFEVYNCCGTFSLVAPVNSQAAASLRVKLQIVEPLRG
jgi:uncharacterized membrane protein (DUF2068 family)